MKKLTIKEFNRQTLPSFREQMQTALDKVSKELGMTLKLEDGGTFSDATFKFSVLADLNVGGVPANVRDFIEHAKMYNLTEKIGDIFRSRGQDYKIVGWRSGRSRYCVETICLTDNRMTYFPLSLIPSYAKRQEEVWQKHQAAMKAMKDAADAQDAAKADAVAK